MPLEEIDVGVAAAPAQAHSTTKNLAIDRWYFTAMSLAMIATVIIGFAPSIFHPVHRRGPLTLLVEVHGMVFFAWLLVYFIQSRLIATRHFAWHRRLGYAAVFLIAAMIPLGYMATIGMVRRGFDLSGNLAAGGANGAASFSLENAVVFDLLDLPIFAALAGGAILYRRRAEIHKRLMLFANIGLMGPALTRIIDRSPTLAALQPGIVMVPFAAFLLAAVARDYLRLKRVQPLTWTVALALLASGPLRGAVIGPSAAWHHFVAWLAR